MTLTDHHWFEVREFTDGVVGIGEPGHFEDVKSYLIIGDERALLFDTGMGFSNIKAVVDRFTAGPVLVVNSHGHWDHVGDNWRFEERWSHPLEADDIRVGADHERVRRFLQPEAFNTPPPPEMDLETFSIPGTEIHRTIDDSDVIDLGGRSFQVLHTPGHSPGGISLFESETGILLVGDAIYEGPMFGQHDGGDAKEYRVTLQRLNQLVASLNVVYPSHNRYPLEPSFLSMTHQSMEEIWNGRPPDAEEDGEQCYSFPGYSFTFRTDWRSTAG